MEACVLGSLAARKRLVTHRRRQSRGVKNLGGGRGGLQLERKQMQVVVEGESSSPFRAPASAPSSVFVTCLDQFHIALFYAHKQLQLLFLFLFLSFYHSLERLRDGCGVWALREDKNFLQAWR